MIRTISLPLIALASLLALACTQESKAAGTQPAAAAPAATPAQPAAAPAPAAPADPAATAAPQQPADPAATAAPQQPAAATQVVRIVFVGKQNACDCTRKRIDASWQALQAALAKKSAVPVERLNIDTQNDQVAFYQGLRSIMAVPAIYFLDAKGDLVEMLQGEVTVEQASGALR